MCEVRGRVGRLAAREDRSVAAGGRAQNGSLGAQREFCMVFAAAASPSCVRTSSRGIICCGSLSQAILPRGIIALLLVCLMGDITPIPGCLLITRGSMVSTVWGVLRCCRCASWMT